MKRAFAGQESSTLRTVRPTVRPLLLAPLVLTALFLPSAASAARPAPDFLGITSEDAFAGSDAYREKVFTDQAAAGVRLVRQPFHWSSIELASGRYELGPYDRFVLAAARHGIRVMPILFDAPGFRERAATTGSPLPRSFRDMVSFAQVLWWRYGPRGTLWRQHPDVPMMPVRSWQVWNEPSLTKYWPPKPSASQYGRMLRQVGSILSAVDPSAEIVTAGIPASRQTGAVPFERYLQGLGRTEVPFDTLAVNAYARNARELIRNLRAARRMLDRNGRKRTKIWITELGWADRGPRSRFRAGRRGQARLIESTFRALERNRKRLKLRGVVYHSWMDGEPYAPHFRDWWGIHTGLVRLDGAPKPALWVFQRTAKRLGWAR
jgi:polysaccharide biosynthesis protein PslG